MARKVKKRGYESPSREEAAARTGHTILREARRLFVTHGFAATTVARIARAARVASDTVYATVGAKPVLFRLLIETALSGTDEPIPALERAYVREIEAEADPGAKVDRFARAVTLIQGRLAPLLRVLRDAGAAEPSLGKLWKEVSDRRAANMKKFAAGLERAGGLRDDLCVDEAADIVWSMNSAEFYELLAVQRGWSPEQFERWLSSAWRRLLLKEPWQPGRS